MNIKAMATNTLPKHYDTAQSFVEDTRFYKVEELYSFRNAPAVRQFLQNHPHLIDFLLESYPYVSKYFGDNPQIVLEIFRDPEVDDSEQLVGYIIASPPIENALDQLEKLDEEWFLDQLDRVNDFFNFNLEFL